MVRNLLLAALALFLFASAGCLQSDSVDTSNAVTEDMCNEYGGSWHLDKCRCAGIAGFSCPPGWVCTELEPEGAADAMGTCKRVSQ